MKLPNGHLAIVDDAKLLGYCLSTTHPRGKHKARLFRRVLGITAANADEFRVQLLSAARAVDAAPTKRNAFGQLYELEFVATGPKGNATTVLSVWIVGEKERIPRLVTAYPV